MFGFLGFEWYEFYVDDIVLSGYYFLSIINFIFDLIKVEFGKLELKDVDIIFFDVVKKSFNVFWGFVVEKDIILKF